MHQQLDQIFFHKASCRPVLSLFNAASPAAEGGLRFRGRPGCLTLRSDWPRFPASWRLQRTWHKCLGAQQRQTTSGGGFHARRGAASAAAFSSACPLGCGASTTCACGSRIKSKEALTSRFSRGGKIMHGCGTAGVGEARSQLGGGDRRQGTAHHDRVSATSCTQPSSQLFSPGDNLTS